MLFILNYDRSVLLSHTFPILDLSDKVFPQPGCESCMLLLIFFEA